MTLVLLPLNALGVRQPVTHDGAIRVGDQMRFSVESIQQLWDDESIDCAIVVEVREIHREADGTKTLVLQRPSYTPVSVES